MPLARADLYSLEDYYAMRGDYRKKVMAHKKNRNLPVGPNATLYFEDRLTIQYQIQEMLRIEKIFDAEGIEEELETYNPLIPDGRNWKATFMIEFDDESERRKKLAEFIGIEKTTWVQVAGHEKVFAICNEDLVERETEEKTSSVHFMRFELTEEMCKDAKSGSAISAGIDLPAYNHASDPMPSNFADSLRADLS